jgi:hypothetical protein
MPFGSTATPPRSGTARVDGGTRGERTGPNSTPGAAVSPIAAAERQPRGVGGQWPVGGISDGFAACLAFFAARFSFRLLPGFFTLLFCGDLSDTTVLPTISGYAHGLTTALRDGMSGTSPATRSGFGQTTMRRAYTLPAVLAAAVDNAAEVRAG